MGWDGIVYTTFIFSVLCVLDYLGSGGEVIGGLFYTQRG
jgi:hypothetical protein